jgi:Spy/CpxP family protein refolding chaperone
MAQPAKRIAVSSVNWAKLAERLTPEQQNELDYLKQQNSTFHAE